MLREAITQAKAGHERSRRGENVRLRLVHERIKTRSLQIGFWCCQLREILHIANQKHYRLRIRTPRNRIHCAQQIKRPWLLAKKTHLLTGKCSSALGSIKATSFRRVSYGDGVNIASRLDALSEPGGICVSASARESLEGKVDAIFVDLGEHNLKNIFRPIKAFAFFESTSRRSTRI
jgi:hypothetical protein